MAVKAGTAYMDIVPNMAKFSQQLSSGATSAINQISSKFKAGFAPLKSLALGVFGGGALLLGLEKLTGASAAYFESVDALRDIYGETTENAAKFVAITKAAGVSSEATSKVLLRLAKAAAPVTGEISAAGEALQKLGVNLVDTEGNILKPMAALEELSRAYEASSDKAAFFANAIGPRGLMIAGVIADYEKIKKAVEGLGIDWTKAVPDEDQVIQLQATQIAMEQVKIQIGTALIPFVTKLNTAFSSFFTDISNGRNIMSAFFDNIIGSSSRAVQLIGAFVGAFVLTKIIKSVRLFGSAFVDLIKLIKAATVASFRWTVATIAQSRALISLVRTEGIAAIATLRVKDAMMLLGGPTVLGGLAAAAAAGFAIGTALDRTFHISEKLSAALIDNSRNAAEAVEQQADSFQSLAEQVKAGELTLEQYTQAVEVLNQKYGSGIDAAAAYKMLTTEVAETVSDAGDDILGTGRKIRRFAGMGKKAFAEWRDSIQDSVRGTITSVSGFDKKWTLTAKGFAKTAKEMAKKAKQIAKDFQALNREAVPEDFQKWLVDQGVDAVHAFESASQEGKDSIVASWKIIDDKSDVTARAVGALDDAGNRLADHSRNVLAPGVNAAGSAFSNATLRAEAYRSKLLSLDGLTVRTTIVTTTSGGGGGGGGDTFPGGQLAHGGPVSARRSYLVGERGPELFEPNVAGRIIPNRALVGGPRTLRIVDWRNGLAELDGELDWRDMA